MKSSSILSLVTAAALVTTIGTSFAAWDILNNSDTAAAITVGQRTTVAVTADKITWSGKLAEGGLDGASPVSGDFTVAVNGAVGKLASVTLAASDFKLDNAAMDDAIANKLTVSFKEGATDLTGGVDSTVTDGDTTYTAVVNAAGLTDDEIAAIAGKSITFDITATAAPVDAPAA